jgi:hypothetical protein
MARSGSSVPSEPRSWISAWTRVSRMLTSPPRNDGGPRRFSMRFSAAAGRGVRRQAGRRRAFGEVVAGQPPVDRQRKGNPSSGAPLQRPGSQRQLWGQAAAAVEFLGGVRRSGKTGQPHGHVVPAGNRYRYRRTGPAKAGGSAGTASRAVGGRRTVMSISSGCILGDMGTICIDSFGLLWAMFFSGRHGNLRRRPSGSTSPPPRPSGER